MKVLVCGVKHVDGVSGKTGNPYDIPRVFALVPIEPGGSPDKMRVRGHGLELSEIALDPKCLDDFAGMRFPLFLDLTTDVQPRYGKFETVVTGFRREAAAPAKAA